MNSERSPFAHKPCHDFSQCGPEETSDLLMRANDLHGADEESETQKENGTVPPGVTSKAGAGTVQSSLPSHWLLSSSAGLPTAGAAPGSEGEAFVMTARKLARVWGAARICTEGDVLTWGGQELQGKEQESPGSHGGTVAQVVSTPCFMEPGNPAV